jgi:Ca-activated chloride channel family protein
MTWLGDFHFLRPLWFFAIVPIGWLAYKLWQKKFQRTGFETHINHELLQHLTLSGTERRSHGLLVGLLSAWLIIIVALAGPTWEKLPQTVFKSESAVVIILDLSPSMMARDIKPSRIIRAHLKIQEILRQRKDGLTALVVYAGEAYTVTPFTSDSQTISNLLTTLIPGILPLPGSNPEMAVELAKNLIESSRVTKASILLFTDDIAEAAVETIVDTLSGDTDLSIIGVGTDAGATIPFNDGLLKDAQQNNIIARRNSNVLKKLTQQTNGYYLPIQADNSDVEFYLSYLEQRADSNRLKANSVTGDRWFESGQLIILLLIPFVLLAFRRGVLLSVLCIGATSLVVQPVSVYADEYQSIWKNENERGLDAWKKKNYNSAIDLFNESQWRGSAYYKNGEYNKALELFEQDKTATGYYNRANAHAQLAQYENAITAYEQALKKDSTLSQAKKNKDIVEKLLQQRNQQNDDKEKKEEQQEQRKKDDQSQDNKNKEDDQQGKQDESAMNNDADSTIKEDKNSESRSDSNQDNRSSNADDNKKASNTTQDEDGDKRAKGKLQENASKATNDDDDNGSDTPSNFDQLNDEQKQQLEQLLRKIPDDPSGLLRRKFEYEFQKRKKMYQQKKWDLPENNAHNRY